MLLSHNGTKVKSLSGFIINKLYNKLSPTKYFKIIVMESGKNDLLKLEENRGTAVKTILRSYNVEQKF